MLAFIIPIVIIILIDCERMDYDYDRTKTFVSDPDSIAELKDGAAVALGSHRLTQRLAKGYQLSVPGFPVAFG